MSPLADDNCKHWVRHSEAMESRAQWAKDLLQEFQSKVQTIIDHHEDTTVVKSPTKETSSKWKGICFTAGFSF